MKWLIPSIVGVVIIAAMALLFFLKPSWISTRFPVGNLSLTAPAQSVAPGLSSIVADEEQPAEKTPEETCADRKHMHIQDCGMGLPEKDYNCRTVEADQVYAECLEEKKAGADTTNQPTTSSTPHETDDHVLPY